MRRFVGWAMLAAPGCSEEPLPPALEADPCPAGQLALAGGRCLAAGMQENGCPAGELGVDGACVPPGVPVEGCGLGFEHDGDDGCRAVLPETCEDGLMAVPGERRCRAVMPCGSGRWGDIDVDAASLHVDASFTGASSDGTVAAPFVTIQAALDAAPEGGLVAVAAGSYAEDVTIERRVRLRGRCPELVEIVGSVSAAAALVVDDAGGSEIGGLALTGESQGLEVRRSADVLVEQIWIHDTDWRGVHVDGHVTPTNVLVRGSLIERVRRLGVWVHSSEVTLEGTVLRDVAAAEDENGAYGDGVFAEMEHAWDPPARVFLSGALIERATKVGVFASAGEVTIDSSLVRDTQPGLDAPFGRGIHVEEGKFGSVALELTGSVVERNVQVGVAAYGSHARIERTVVRDVTLASDGTGGRGIEVEPVLARPSLTIEQSSISGCRGAGLFARGADVEAVALAVRDIEPGEGGLGGEGIAVRSHPELGRSALTLSASRIERAHEAGLLLQGSDATLEGLAVRETFGIGLALEIDVDESARAIVRSSSLESSLGFGLEVAGSEVELEAVWIRDVAVLAERFGDGAALVLAGVPASAEVRGSRIEAASRAGIASFGSSLALLDTRLECNPTPLSAQSVEARASAFQDAGGNLCACGSQEASCSAVTVELEPPTPIGSSE